MKKLLHIMLLIFMLMVSNELFAQSVAINSDGSSADASAMLDVQATDKGFLPPRVVSTGDITSPASGLLVYQTGGTAGYYYYNGSAWIQLGAASGASQWTTTGSDIYYNSGNVGIGNASPTYDLDISGNNFRLRAPSSESSYLVIDNTDADQLSTIALQTQGGEGLAYLGLAGGSYTFFGGNNSLNFWNQTANGPISFGTHNGTSAAERVRIDNDGNVGIGTILPSYTLDVSGDLRASGGDIFFPNLYTFQTQNYSDLRINPSNGRVAIEMSSERYKENIIDMEDVSWIYNLRPVNFNLKADSQNMKAYGLIAEEVVEVAPEFVFYRDDIIEGVTYSKFISPLIKTVQEQKQTIDALEQRLQALETVIEEMRNR